MITWDELRAIALSLPGLEEGTSYGTPAFRVRGRFLARLWPNEPGVLVLRLSDVDEQASLTSLHPETYFVTDHYRGHPSVLVRLSGIESDELAELLGAAWRLNASRWAVAAFDRAESRGERDDLTI